ncbi:tight junction protein ZO-1-like [Liolophura sinensis]|uniref:tight junction protein ZO-1-like n=1 Tax=Liolophura sinensis TaxID=3198878 RepID=UPI0031585D2B
MLSDRLNYAQYYPITVFLKAESKTNVKDQCSKFAKNSTKNPKKLFEQSQKLEKIYSHLFTGVISHNSTDAWYSRLLEMIEVQQNSQIWISEFKPEEDISDDVLFPMTSRLSFVASPESDLDLSRTHDVDTLPRFHGSKPGLVRSSSDPSIATVEKVPGIPPYPSPPQLFKWG